MPFYNAQDKIYLNKEECRKENPRETFKFVINQTYEELNSIDRPVVVDVGCGNGDFLYYMKSQTHNNASLYGIDYSEELLRLAEDKNPDMSFLKGNIYYGEGLPNRKFDIAYMLGLNSLFSEYEPWINGLLKIIKETGIAYVFGPFNPSNLDVQVNVRKPGETIYEDSYFNTVSIQSIKLYLDAVNCQYRFKKFNIPFLLPQKEDPLRAYTIELKNDVIQEMVGSQQLLHFYLLEIKKRNA